METKEDIIKDLLYKLMRIINKRSRIETLRIRFDDDLELTPREIHTIEAIGKAENINVKELGDRFGVTKSAASQSVSKLERRGLVFKEPAAHSNKELRVRLTDSGWSAFHAHERHHEKHMADLVAKLETFSLSQIATTSVLLETIEDVMDSRLKHFPKQ